MEKKVPTSTQANSNLEKKPVQPAETVTSVTDFGSDTNTVKPVKAVPMTDPLDIKAQTDKDQKFKTASKCSNSNSTALVPKTGKASEKAGGSNKPV